MRLDLCSATAATETGFTCLSEAVLEEDSYFSLFLALKQGQSCHLSTLQKSLEGMLNLMLM